MITAAATLHANNVTDIQTSAQAAEALRPIAGALAETIFALASSAPACCPFPSSPDRRHTPSARRGSGRRARQPMEAKAFYAVICIATIVGMIMNFTPIDPIRASYWSAVINGVVAVPVVAIMMWLVAAPKVMGEFVVAGWVKALGWVATAVLALAVVAMLATS